MDRVALDLGVIQIYWYSIFIFLGVLFGCIVVLKECKKQKIDQNFMTDLIFYTIIIGFIGARLYYCLFNLDYYLKYPLEILQIWKGGLAIHGGIIAGLLFIVYYTKKHKVKLSKITDISVQGLILAQAIGRWGNFFNQEAYGQEISRQALENLHLPNFIIEGMYIEGRYYQPTFLYESIWNIIGFVVLLLVKRCKKLKSGQLTAIYMMWYAIGRFIIESFRSDSLMLGTIKVAQFVSIVMLIVGFIIFILPKKQAKKSKEI